MQETFQKVKELKSQIAFFVFLCIAVLLGKLLMMSLAAAEFSEPIELEYAGISAAVPTGVQWESQEQWRYGSNSFYLTSTFRSAQGRPSGSLRCRFLLESTASTLDELLSQKISEFSTEANERGYIEKGDFIIQWINIKIPESYYEMYYGIGRLPSNHLIEIEVQKIESEFNANAIFEDVLKKLRLEQIPPIQAGIDIIKQMKSKGTAPLLNEFDSPSAFVIIDSQSNPLGFTLEVFSKPQAKESLVFESEVLYYLREPYSHWESASFYGNRDITEYIWRSERITSRSKGEFQTTLDKNGIVTLTELSVPPSDKKYQPSLCSIPEVFSDMLVSYILESETEQVHIEVIESNGKIIPLSIFRVEPDIAKPGLESSASALQINFLDDSGLSQKIYFDENGKTMREILILPVSRRGFLSSSSSHEILTLVRSTAENLAIQFPEQAEQIKEKISKIDVN
jgi:hypothetical protein